MKTFNYLEPSSVEEARALLSEHAGDAALLAGGVTLVSFLKQEVVSPGHVIDIKNLSGLDYVRDDLDGVRIGALTTMRTIGRSPVIHRLFPGLIDMESTLYDVQTRNWGTLGGNLAFAGRHGEPACVLASLGASVVLSSSRGERRIDLKNFATGHRSSVLRPDEMLVEVHIPRPGPRTGGAYGKEARRSDHTPIVSVAVALMLDEAEQRIEGAKIVVGAAFDVPTEVSPAQALLIGSHVDNAPLGEASTLVAEAIPASPVTNGSLKYKREITDHLVRRVMATALDRCRTSKRSQQ